MVDVYSGHDYGSHPGRIRFNQWRFADGQIDGDRCIVIASYGGAATNPPWYHNLLSNPEVGVEVGSEQFTAKADVLDEPERTELYAKMIEIMPVFSEYQSKTTRVIPVVALTRL